MTDTSHPPIHPDRAPVVIAVLANAHLSQDALVDDLLDSLDTADLERGIVRLDTRDIYTAAFVINSDEVRALPPTALVSDVVAAVLAFIRRVGNKGVTGPRALGTWDIGDPEPEGVGSVRDGFADDEDDDNNRWGKTTDGKHWKGYKNGGKVYLEWAELVRRWGPVTLP